MTTDVAQTNQVGNYTVLEKLGTGAMGTVYKAQHTSTGQIVALKILNPDMARDNEMAERFCREIQITSQFNHPNIVKKVEAGLYRHTLFFVMEFVDGMPLSTRLEREKKLTEALSLDLCRQVALGLDHAHSKNYLHRDIKSENILVTHDGVAKLTDMGLARVLNGWDQTKALTRGGIAVGSPCYMSPEQATGETELGPGTDLYSLGVVLYECLTGTVPFDDKDCYTVMFRQINDPPPDPRTHNPAISERSAKICLKLLEKNPKSRFLTAKALADELQQSPVLAAAEKSDGGISRPTPAPRRLRFE